VLESAGRKRLVRTTRDRAGVVDQKSRKSWESKAIGVTVTRARQQDAPLGGPPMVIPSFRSACGPRRTAEANTTLRRAARGRWKRRERHLALDDEIREAVKHS
jgi:hypothetical protein